MVASAGSNTTVQLLIQPEASVHHPEKTPKGPPTAATSASKDRGFCSVLLDFQGCLSPRSHQPGGVSRATLKPTLSRSHSTHVTQHVEAV